MREKKEKKNILFCHKAKASANVMVTVRVPINNFLSLRRPMGTLEPVLDCVVVVGVELEQSLEEEGRTGAASDIVKVIDWVLPF